jgi:transcriptional regulator with XRE-family HTH domain
MNNLKLLRKRRNASQNDVAEYLGVTRAAYGQYETGTRSMNPDVLARLSDYFGVSVDVILGRESVTEPFGKKIDLKPELVAEDEIMIPVVASLRCGFGRSGEATFRERKPVPKSYINRWGKDIVYYEAVGESMLPTITPGDLLVTIPGSTWEDGWIVVVDINDSDTIKRIYRTEDGGINLVPDNVRHYKTMHLTPEDLKTYNVAILGHVVKAIGADL